MSAETKNYEALFAGVIGQEYEMLKLICPLMTDMSRRVGETVEHYPKHGSILQAIELGGGTGITTLALLSARDDLHILSVDNEPTMQNQAKQNLQKWHNSGHLTFSSLDALSALQAQETNSLDIVASAYTLHNFLDEYRYKVITEIYRVLKPGGWFINGDRYALDDISQHTRMIQEEVSSYFKVLTEINRLDLLEHWIVHLFSDESSNHVMREGVAIQQMQATGFMPIIQTNRMAVNLLMQGVKPI